MELASCNASEGIEHRNNQRVGGRYCSLSSRQQLPKGKPDGV